MARTVLQNIAGSIKSGWSPFKAGLGNAQLLLKLLVTCWPLGDALLQHLHMCRLEILANADYEWRRKKTDSILQLVFWLKILLCNLRIMATFDVLSISPANSLTKVHFHGFSALKNVQWTWSFNKGPDRILSLESRGNALSSICTCPCMLSDVEQRSRQAATDNGRDQHLSWRTVKLRHKVLHSTQTNTHLAPPGGIHINTRTPPIVPCMAN